MSLLKNPLFIIGLILGAVLLVNLILFLGFRRGNHRDDSTYRVFGQALNLFKNPWKNENAQIDELASLVESIEEKNKLDD